jgi:hypothetical protein
VLKTNELINSYLTKKLGLTSDVFFKEIHRS